MNINPESVLTPQGIVAFAALIATIIQIAKRVPNFGAWLNANREPTAVLVISVALVIFSALAAENRWNLDRAFQYFMSWISIAGLSTKAYDVAPTSVKTALSGVDTGQ